MQSDSIRKDIKQIKWLLAGIFCLLSIITLAVVPLLIPMLILGLALWAGIKFLPRIWRDIREQFDRLSVSAGRTHPVD